MVTEVDKISIRSRHFCTPQPRSRSHDPLWPRSSIHTVYGLIRAHHRRLRGRRLHKQNLEYCVTTLLPDSGYIHLLHNKMFIPCYLAGSELLGRFPGSRRSVKSYTLTHTPSTGLRHPSSNHYNNAIGLVGAQMATQIISGVSFKTTYARTHKTKMF